ncbi:MAG: hypothetical protein K8S25_06975, partial [Alphaproteobacteria bacterium]|nr:hypothetical protein [Alphaproteobacteria bacterium]
VGPDGEPLSSLVDVSGKIDAGAVQLTARAARGLIDNVINVDGEIIASGVKQSGGSVQLTGEGNGLPGYGAAIAIDGGANGVAIAGALSATTGAEGGSIAINGARIALNNARLDASGDSGGGSIAIGYSGEGAARTVSADVVAVSAGSRLSADAIESGDGGRIVLWSKLATDFRGALSAKGGAQSGNGGFLEVSSKEQIGFSGLADASAANGEAGQLLLDPKNLIIASPGVPVAGLTDPNQLIFGYQPGLTLTVDPTFITASLNTGTAVTLQASNDLSVLSDIIANRPFGDGGTLTLQAGRSVFINARIVTDDGNLNVIANELLSAGVVNLQRDPGAAVLSMGAGGSIDAGAGDVRLTIASGAGKSFTQSGDMTLRSITANRIVAENLGPSNGNVVVAGGVLTGTSTGTGIALAAKGGNFVNTAGAGALATPNGRWLVFSTTPLANTFGGLTGSPYYNTAYNPADPTNFGADGDRFVYTIAPVLHVRADNLSREYGEFNPDLTFSVTGFIGGDDPALAIEGSPFLSTLASETSNAGAYAISVGLQNLVSDYNYTISLDAGVLTVVPAQLFYRAFGVSRVYGDDNPDFSGEIFGFKLGETLADVTTGTASFGTTATPTTNVGLYAINGSGVSVVSSNYQPVILQEAPNATALEITQAQLTYVANLTTREYGDANVLTGVLAGLKNGETIAQVASGTMTFTSATTATSPLGVYEVVGGGLTLLSGNYFATIAQDAGNAEALTITAAQLFYRADAKSKIYGQANPIFTGTVTGLKNGETLASVTEGTLIWTSNAIDGSDADVYAIAGEGLTVTSGNYFIDILQAPENDNAFTINQAQLIYRAVPTSRIFGFPDPAFEGELLGLTNGDAIDDAANGDMVFTTTTTGTSPAGLYALNGGGLTVASANYLTTILQDPGNATAFEIVAIPLTSIQTQQESEEEAKSAVAEAEGSTSSRSNELGISGVNIVSDDMADGSNDELPGQLCVLNAPDMPKAGCKAPKSSGQ